VGRDLCTPTKRPVYTHKETYAGNLEKRHSVFQSQNITYVCGQTCVHPQWDLKSASDLWRRPIQETLRETYLEKRHSVFRFLRSQNTTHVSEETYVHPQGDLRKRPRRETYTEKEDIQSFTPCGFKMRDICQKRPVYTERDLWTKRRDLQRNLRER